MSIKDIEEMEFNESSLNQQTFLLVLLASAIGMLIAAIVLPNWLPNLVSSLEGADPKGYWYLSRGTAFVALGLLWISVAFGVSITNKMARVWPGGPAAFAIHEFTSLLGLVFVLCHGLLLLGDRYINYDLAQILVPFTSRNYAPLWVGIGQVCFYLWAIVAFTFYVRRRIGQKSWRFVHYAGYLTFVMALLHGITSGADTLSTWTQWLYWLMGGSLLFLFIYRLLNGLGLKNETKSISITPIIK